VRGKANGSRVKPSCSCSCSIPWHARSLGEGGPIHILVILSEVEGSLTIFSYSHSRSSSTSSLVLMLDFTIRSITHHVSPSPADSSLRSRAHSAHAYKSSSCSHPCALTIPEPCEYHSHSPASGWQRNDATCDSSLPC